MSIKPTLTSVLCSATTALVIMSFYSLALLNDSHSQRQSNDTSTPSIADMRMLSELQQSIQALQQSQLQLRQQNNHLHERIAQLLQASSGSASNDAEDMPTGTAATDIKESLSEQDIIVNHDIALMKFEELRDKVRLEDYDSAWASEMDIALDEVEQRLKMLNLNRSTIVNKDCRTQGCLVEFVHQGDVNESLLATALAAQGTSEMVLKHIHEDDQTRTLAIYMR